ncbi:MAG: ECF-type sigma factor [Pirellulales bacterium]
MLVETIQNEPSNSSKDSSERLFALIYDELYKLAQDRLRHESVGHTLQPTALVNEVYLRLVAAGNPREWDGTGHFFAAAARAMRQVLIDNARRRQALKRLPPGHRIDLATIDTPDFSIDDDQLLSLHEALNELEQNEPTKARLVEMRFFAGMEMEQICSILEISRATAHRYWSHARAWLFLRLA